MDYRTNENYPESESREGRPETQWNADSGSQESMTSKMKSQVSGAAQSAKEAAQSAKEKVMETGRKAAERMDQGRQSAARGLGDAASTLHQKADNLPGVQKIQQAAHATAQKMERTADYLREHDFSAMVTDVEDSIRRRPGAALALAVFAGFLIGRMFRSHDTL
jgi:ElaB/YqjD/DUF883 family membrane-anchored ribosome-binding protein